LVKLATEALHSIYMKGYSYKKAGVIVTGFVPDGEIQQELFSETRDLRHKRLMESIDNINRLSAQPLVKIATQGSGRAWKLRQEQLSPKYTTQWNEILEIRT
jgi:DNA polymerase V